MSTNDWPHAHQILDPFPPGPTTLSTVNHGGNLGWLYDAFCQRGDWFALYAKDGRIDDETFCEEIKRGKFGLHQKVGTGISKGCITIDRQSDFNRILSILKGAPKQDIYGTKLTAYGSVFVR
jgi:hypothetical protein